MIDFDRHLMGPVMRTYGSEVRYRRPPGGWSIMPALMDKREQVATFGEGAVPVRVISITLGVRLALVPGGLVPEQNDEVQIATIGDQQYPFGTAGSSITTYVVMDVEHEGEGGAVLRLQLA